MNLNNISSINKNNILDINNIKKTNLETESFEKTLNNAIENGEEKKLKEACEQFESYFLNMMFKSMRKSNITAGGIFEKSNAEKIFQDMFDEEISIQAAKTGGVGIADIMYKQLSKQNKNLDIKA